MCIAWVGCDEEKKKSIFECKDVICTVFYVHIRCNFFFIQLFFLSENLIILWETRHKIPFKPIVKEGMALGSQFEFPRNRIEKKRKNNPPPNEIRENLWMNERIEKEKPHEQITFYVGHMRFVLRSKKKIQSWALCKQT